MPLRLFARNCFAAETLFGAIPLDVTSCLTNMLCFLEEITKWIDEISAVDVIYLDFQKAFDKVPHQSLLLKLKTMVSGIA